VKNRFGTERENNPFGSVNVFISTVFMISDSIAYVGLGGNETMLADEVIMEEKK